MQIRHIEYFLALCDQLSFTRAAKACGVSQPSLTNGIQSLELDLGAELISRKPVVQLTEAGVAIRPHLERALMEIQQARIAAGQRASTTLPNGSHRVNGKRLLGKSSNGAHPQSPSDSGNVPTATSTELPPELPPHR
jgi:DNA-binding transcriptional LysR family regulator